MRQFRNDYSEGAAPVILDALVRTNFNQTVGYGEDEHCARAAELIRAACNQPDAFVRFLPGGTAVNIVAISSLTEEFEGPILAADAHPTAHETGAIEGAGRRLLATRDPFGILTPAEVERVALLAQAGGHHTTRPGMLYFSNTSELGHVYTKAEFDALCDVAQAHGLAVYVDGARMASGLAAEGGDLTLEHLASRADAFTLGGTKNGMLFGEALVVSPRTERGRRAIERIPFLTKRTGALTAKGRLMGVQFEAAFDPANATEDGTLPYFALARTANACATRLAAGMREAGFEEYVGTTGNQRFFWVTPSLGDTLSQELGAELAIVDDPTGAGRLVARFVTSWACTEREVDEALDRIRILAQDA
ncbi:MAG: beta-eliminating lyase-related protein [Collinsella sp.]|nr:beta-eliminating lyase-related protein [Collinsella sp.]